jgi:hypothetical protein
MILIKITFIGIIIKYILQVNCYNFVKILSKVTKPLHINLLQANMMMKGVRFSSSVSACACCKFLRVKPKLFVLLIAFRDDRLI